MIDKNKTQQRSLNGLANHTTNRPKNESLNGLGSHQENKSNSSDKKKF